MWIKFLENKICGYEEDKLETTHPIYCQVENTDKVYIFDGIMDHKSTALMKQLFFMMGE